MVKQEQTCVSNEEQCGQIWNKVDIEPEEVEKKKNPKPHSTNSFVNPETVVVVYWRNDAQNHDRHTNWFHETNILKRSKGSID